MYVNICWSIKKLSLFVHNNTTQSLLTSSAAFECDSHWLLETFDLLVRLLLPSPLAWDSWWTMFLACATWRDCCRHAKCEATNVTKMTFPEYVLRESGWDVIKKGKRECYEKKQDGKIFAFFFYGKIPYYAEMKRTEIALSTSLITLTRLMFDEDARRR